MSYQKFFWVISVLIGINMGSHAAQLDDELLRIVGQAKRLSDPTIQLAFRQEKAHRRARIEELQFLSKKVSAGANNFDKEFLKDKLSQRLLRDEKAIARMNAKLKPLMPEVDITWDLKANKMIKVLAGTSPPD